MSVTTKKAIVGDIEIPEVLVAPMKLCCAMKGGRCCCIT